MALRIPSDHRRQWHRFFGLLLIDHLQGTPFTVELEKDLSHRQQLVDVVIVRRGPGEMKRHLPDGFEDLADHNLITFKSFQEPFDDWTLKELTGHYVNYRKQVSPPRQELLPEAHFKLYGICARYPRDLFRNLEPKKLQDGVFDLRRGSDVFRLIVAGELPKKEENSLLHLFSASSETVKYGAEHYHLQSQDMSSIINDLFQEYRQEGLTMPYTMEDYRRDRARKALNEITPEERQEYMNEMTPEERLEYLNNLTPEERLAGLSEKVIRAYLDRLHKSPSASQKGKGKRRSP